MLTSSGEPVRSAFVEIWQVDHTGSYVHTRGRQPTGHDANFQGYGRFLTDSDGFVKFSEFFDEEVGQYVPVDEDHPTVPEDSYAMSKVANEVTARSFQARTGADVYGLRINNVIEPHEYAEMFPALPTGTRCRSGAPPSA